MKKTNSATAKYDGLGKEAKGLISTKSGALADQPYGFNTRFEDKRGNNPEELIAAAHAACFTMALSFNLAKEGYEAGSLETTADVLLEDDGDGFKVSKSTLKLTGTVEGIEPAKFEEIARGAKENCPISKLLSCDIALEIA